MSFNLSEERNFMRFEMMLKENKTMALLLDVIERQDKEFIRRVKDIFSEENYPHKRGMCKQVIKKIDNLAGDKLV